MGEAEREEAEELDRPLLAHVSSGGRKKPWRRHLPLVYSLVSLQVLNILLFVATPPILARVRQPMAHTTDEFFALSEFNRSWLFDHDDSDESWEDIYLEHGLISIDAEWADHHGLPPSSATPDVPGETSYQIGVFHSLHCLSMIRVYILAQKTNPHPHLKHCLLHLRYDVMCHADLALGDTEDLVHYDFPQPRKCRDFDAIRRWAYTFRWKGFMDWTLANEHPNETVESLTEQDRLDRLPVMGGMGS